MKLIIHEDIAKVIEFMQHNLPVRKFQKIARGLVQLCELIYPEDYPWQRMPFFAFTLERESFKPASPTQHSDSSATPPSANLSVHSDQRAASPQDVDGSVYD